MSDTVVIGREKECLPKKEIDKKDLNDKYVPEIKNLELELINASQLVNDIILKKYLHSLSDLEVIPLDEDLKNISDIRIFKITEMVYQNNEYSTYKFASVFNAVQNLNCGVFIIADSDANQTNFYMGVRSHDSVRTTKSLKDTLKNALCGQFPGVKTKDMLDSEAEEFLSEIATKNITSVSCVAKNKDNDFNKNETYIQGLEKLALAMQGQKYTAIILAKSTPTSKLEEVRQAYESIYSSLFPFANLQMSYGSNKALSISNALTNGTSKGLSTSKTESKQNTTSHTKSKSENFSISKTSALGSFAKVAGNLALGLGSLVAAPLTGGASLAAAGALMAGRLAIDSFNPKVTSVGNSDTESYTESESNSYSETFTENESSSQSETNTSGETTGTSNTIQLTTQNKTLVETLKKIEIQLKRINECENIGMWESAAYFLSDSRETAEMAAGTYKALMKGNESGVETSAINFWGKNADKEVQLIREYITNFIHPLFKYNLNSLDMPVSATSLVSSNELAIQMGLPRKSVCGFPVIEHAEFGNEVIKYDDVFSQKDFTIGNIYRMGEQTQSKVKLDCNSLTMHTFVTGSTGSGKSNTIYEIINQVNNLYKIPFLIIEPAKGEYKNIFGNYPDVKVFGTNPRKTDLLKLNPFSFDRDIHVLEHIDRLIEIFNVCWPMYAAMPAVLKNAIEKSYIDCGWDLKDSTNKYNNSYYPTFKDVARNIKSIIDSSEYDTENKGAYKGSLLTRLESLTNGINGLIFTKDELTNEEIFDNNVIVDLSRVGSSETKSLIMGILVLKLQEYRLSVSGINENLKHLTVIEEAHNLLKRTSLEQSSDSSNLQGKSVEMLSNAIAEMRTYGEGFIIADQAPALLDMSVIRNTNTKIIMRLPDETDRNLVGRASNLNDEQIKELARLSRGVAAIYQNQWIEPVLCKINKMKINENEFQYSCQNYKKNKISFKDRDYIASLLIQSNSLSKELIIKEIQPILDKLLLDDFTKVSIMNYLNQSTNNPEILKLAPVMSALYPESKESIIKAYNDSKNPLNWSLAISDSLDITEEYTSLLLKRIIIQAIITDHILLEKNNISDLEKWSKEGCIR